MNSGNTQSEVFDSLLHQPKWNDKIEAWNIILKSWDYLGEIRCNLNTSIFTSWRRVAVAPIKRHYNEQRYR